MKWLLRLWDLLVVLVLLAALVLAFGFVGSRFIGYTPFIVTSGSMQSLYPVGSIIYVKEVAPEEVQVGDSITFYLGGDTIATHQVWQIDETARAFRTQGVDNRDADGNIQQDASPVPFDALIGVPVLCVPKLGVVYDALKGPVGLCAVVFVVVLIALVSVLTAPKAKEQADGSKGVPSSDEPIKKVDAKEKRQ